MGQIMKMRITFSFAALLLCRGIHFRRSFGSRHFGQKEERRERTIDEIKTEAIHRAEVGQYPLIGLDPGDVKEAFESIHTGDKDEWAAGFMRVADRYFNEAKSLEKVRSRQGQRRLHPRVAALFVRTLADSSVSGQAALV